MNDSVEFGLLAQYEQECNERTATLLGRRKEALEGLCDAMEDPVDCSVPYLVACAAVAILCELRERKG